MAGADERAWATWGRSRRQHWRIKGVTGSLGACGFGPPWWLPSDERWIEDGSLAKCIRCLRVAP